MRSFCIDRPAPCFANRKGVFSSIYPFVWSYSSIYFYLFVTKLHLQPNVIKPFINAITWRVVKFYRMKLSQQLAKKLGSFLPAFLLHRLRNVYLQWEYSQWEKNGCPVPPPHIVKQRTIAGYQQKSGIGLLVETGTYMGNMVEAQKNRFDQIISIELADGLYQKATERFRKDAHVTIVHGDSGHVLPDLMKGISQPAIFWLDGHYSSGPTARGEKDCPIFEEIDAIFNGRPLPHILLIDDARCFDGTGDYPTIEQLTQYVQAKNDRYRLEVTHDIIRYVIG